MPLFGKRQPDRDWFETVEPHFVAIDRTLEDLDLFLSFGDGESSTEDPPLDGVPNARFRLVLFKRILKDIVPPEGADARKVHDDLKKLLGKYSDGLEAWMKFMQGLGDLQNQAASSQPNLSQRGKTASLAFNESLSDSLLKQGHELLGNVRRYFQIYAR
jgi:hypothetical protein